MFSALFLPNKNTLPGTTDSSAFFTFSCDSIFGEIECSKAIFSENWRSLQLGKHAHERKSHVRKALGDFSSSGRGCALFYMRNFWARPICLAFFAKCTVCLNVEFFGDFELRPATFLNAPCQRILDLGWPPSPMASVNGVAVWALLPFISSLEGPPQGTSHNMLCESIDYWRVSGLHWEIMML